MRRFRLAVFTCVALATILAPAVQAQSSPTSGQDRMFLSFFEEATLVEGQWWEGDLQYSDLDTLDTWVLRGVAAFRLRDKFEVGGTIGFGSSDSNVDGLPDGTGATDLDLYGKYYFGGKAESKTEWAAGGLFTLPTGDNTAGLGQDAFRLGGFGSMRLRGKRVIYNGNLGFAINGDAEFPSLPTGKADGEFSVRAGFGVIFPRSDKLSWVLETKWESNTYDDGSNIWSVLGGVDWRAGSRGLIRAAVDVGLEDGAPDLRVTAGYAQTF